MENVYTLLQPPRSAARSPSEGADGKMNDHQEKTTLVLSPPPVPGIPHPSVRGSKHPFYSPREVQSVILSFYEVYRKCLQFSVFDSPSVFNRYLK